MYEEQGVFLQKRILQPGIILLYKVDGFLTMLIVVLLIIKVVGYLTVLQEILPETMSIQMISSTP